MPTGVRQTFSQSDSPCHNSLFVFSRIEFCSPVCCFGIKTPLNSFIFCFFILSGGLSLSRCCFFWRFELSILCI